MNCDSLSKLFGGALMATQSTLITDPIGPVLWKQSVPTAIGVVFMILVNLIDTYWAAKLGTNELAAMSFTFPIIGIVMNISIGLMIGTSVVIARTVGAGEDEKAKRISTHALILGMLIVLVVSGAGLLTQNLLFSALGAPAELLPTIASYMQIWYLGAVFLLVPMIINGVLRAKGDAKTTMNTMIMGAVFNAILDPIFIFGFGAVPAMGLEGAAIATVISRAITMVYAGYVMIGREKMLLLQQPKIPELIDSWKGLMRVGIPVMATNVLGPIATAMLTTIVALYGSAAVAAYGIGARMEGLVLIPVLALSSGLSPFIGQNWGAHLEDRVAKGFELALKFSAAWGLFALGLLFFGGPYIAALFSEDPVVQKDIAIYLRVVPIGYGAYGAMMMVNSTFNAIDYATRSTVLSVLRSIVFAVPFAATAYWLELGLYGVFASLAVGSVLSLLIGLRWMKPLLNPEDQHLVDSRSELEQEIEYLLMHTDDAMTARMKELVEAIIKLDGVELHHVRDDAVGFYVGHRQLAHIHPSGHLDMPLPIEIGDVLVDRKWLSHHRLYENNGWYSHELHSEKDISEAQWLLQLAHALYEIKTRGRNAEITQAELAELKLDDCAYQHIVTAAERWGVNAA